MAEVINLGNGADFFFRLSLDPDSVVSGENGDDTLLVVLGNRVTLDGGRGADVLAIGGNDNLLLGGQGDDSLTAVGIRNSLNGGQGEDTFISVSFGLPFQIGAGNTLTGEKGQDSYVLASSSDLRVLDPELNNIVNNGETIAGIIDVIRDYTSGEALHINLTTLLDEVHLTPGLTILGGNRLILNDGEYAAFRGDLVADGRFTVSDSGHDLLIVYDEVGLGDGNGAVALVGVTNIQDVLIQDVVIA